MNGQTYGGMEVKWKDIQVKFECQGHRSRSPGQKRFFNEMYSSDTAATRKRLMQMKPGFLLSACRIALDMYVEFNFIYECWGYDAGCFQSVCVFFQIRIGCEFGKTCFGTALVLCC